MTLKQAGLYIRPIKMYKVPTIDRKMVTQISKSTKGKGGIADHRNSRLFLSLFLPHSSSNDLSRTPHSLTPTPIRTHKTHYSFPADLTMRGLKEVMLILGLMVGVSLDPASADGFVIPTNVTETCVAIETSHPISKILSSSPSTVGMSFKLSPKLDYEREFGIGSSTKKDHQSHFSCVLEIAKQLEQIIENFLDNVIEYVNYRKEAYLQGMIGKVRRDIGSSGPLPANDSLTLSLGTEKVSEEELEGLIAEISRVSFVQNRA